MKKKVILALMRSPLIELIVFPLFFLLRLFEIWSPLPFGLEALSDDLETILAWFLYLCLLPSSRIDEVSILKVYALGSFRKAWVMFEINPLNPRLSWKEFN